MTDKTLIQSWKEDYINNKNKSKNSECEELAIRNGLILYEMMKLQNEFNKNEYESEKIVHHYWWLYKVAERIMKKFNIKKSIYDNDKATKVWAKCYRGEHFKKKCQSNFIPSTTELYGLIEGMMNDDINGMNHYLYILNKLKQITNGEK